MSREAIITILIMKMVHEENKEERAKMALEILEIFKNQKTENFLRKFYKGEAWEK